MADSTRPVRSVRWRMWPALLATAPGLSLFAQVPEASYPVDPVAAAGMTSGLPNTITSRQIEMMQVRTSAQSAQGEAAAASMARSADQSIEERNREAALEAARTNKAIKEAMRNRLRFEAASAQHNKVSVNDMSTWEQNGGVRVERNVPNAFIRSLIAEEEQAAARASASAGRKRFSLFGGDDGPSDGSSLLSAIRPPRLPFLGGGDSGAPSPAPAPATAPVEDNSEPVFAQGNSSRSAAPSSPAPSAAKPGTVPRISGAALVDGNSSVGSGEPAPAASSSTVSFSDATPEPRKRLSLFSRSDSAPDEDLVPTARESTRRSGFFSFGKKAEPAPAPGIDASLFPSSTIEQAARGSRVSGGVVSTPSRSTDEFASDSPSGSSLDLPTNQVERERSGFSLPKPSLSLPSVSMPNLTRSSGGGSAASTSPGTYVVSSTAQFMVYGADQMQSEIRALPAGTTVMVTKPGEQWSGIQLQDGTEGVVQNKNLRPAR